MRVPYILVMLFLFSSCNSQDRFLEYNLSNPSIFLKLPSKLNEISGLEINRRNSVLAVQDELGTLYVIDTRNGKIKREFSFGKEGDYEGVAKVAGTIYTLQSNGTIIEIAQNGESKKFEFKHSKQMDFEGMCYDWSEKQLLVACKENLKKGNKKELFIYSFDLNEKKYNKKPFFHFDRKKVHKNFKPSGIAIHPNGSIFILSSFSKTLLAINRQGKIIKSTQLKEYIFHQPEGITFDNKGRLIISNEKYKTYPTLLIFNPNE